MPQERSKPFPIPASWTMQLPELRCQDWMLPLEAQKLPRLESLCLQLFLTVLWSSKRIHGILRSQHTSTWKCLKCSLPERSCLLPAAQCSEGNEEHYSKIIKPRKLANKVCKASMGKKKPLLAQIGKKQDKNMDSATRSCWEALLRHTEVIPHAGEGQQPPTMEWFQQWTREELLISAIWTSLKLWHGQVLTPFPWWGRTEERKGNIYLVSQKKPS